MTRVSPVPVPGDEGGCFDDDDDDFSDALDESSHRRSLGEAAAPAGRRSNHAPSDSAGAAEVGGPVSVGAASRSFVVKDRGEAGAPAAKGPVMVVDVL